MNDHTSRYCNRTHDFSRSRSSSSSFVKNTRRSLPALFQPNILCAGTEVGGIGSCPGDSGGPLIKFLSDFEVPFYEQVAIVHGGVGSCGDREFPGIYARVADAEVLTFIRAEAGMDPPSPRRPNPLRPATTTTTTTTKAPRVSGGWSAWDSWGHCSSSCLGYGTRSRRRYCRSSEPRSDCPGRFSQTESCGEVPCAIDGNWSRWGEWSRCTRTCGGGTRERHRACTDPAPQDGGRDCENGSLDIEECGEYPCPADEPPSKG